MNFREEMRNKMKKLVGLIIASLLVSQFPALTAERPLAADERVLWFPALATPSADGWKVTLSGIVTEDENRRVASWTARKFLGFSEEELGSAERAIFRERTQRFFGDDERGKRIEVEILGQRHDLGRTGRNGRFEKTIRFASEKLRPGPQTLPAIVSANKRSVSNKVDICAISAAGISVVSDIDDTIKVSDVRNRDELMRNTFLRPFRPVEGIADVYRRWATNSDAQFHYVSGSPWQLFTPLDAFIATNRFPTGSWHLRSLRLLDMSALQLSQTPDAHKRTMIEDLFTRLPERRFVLVGDSGERDPEIYGDLARRHPRRVTKIFIRDVTNEPITAERYLKAFKGVPKDSCEIFKSAEKLPRTLKN
jgi:phosphatidate phosphatase APP1